MQYKVLDSRYELLEQIGMGGMAIVYKAMDKLLNRYVAIKILREEYKENEEFIRRFNIESQAAASLSHQNIVQIYDVGEEDGIHYIVMELLEGETLKQYINANGGKLSKREATNFAMQICRALEHAHSKHVVHRDIKPQNIIITEKGKLKVADFGIARAANNSTMVNAGKNAIGSAHYLSPEQARGGYTDLRSDIYSLGVVMYEMFTGKLPFDAEESVSVVLQHLQEEAPLPCEVNPEIPAGIEAIIVRCMKKEQRLRYNNATEILGDLISVYQNPEVSVGSLNALKSEGMDNIPKRSSPSKKRSSQSSDKKKKKGNSGLIATIIICTAIIAGVLIWGWQLLFPQSVEVELPDVVGLTYEEAATKAKESSTDTVKFTLIQSTEEFSEEPKGTIIKQTPEGNSNVKKSREIRVVVSRGPVVMELGNYEGKHFKNIKDSLEEEGLTVKIIEEDSENYSEGLIIKQLPLSGTKMAEGDEVTLHVSKGVEQKIVPDVVGKTREEALVAIEEKGLKVGTIHEEDSERYAKGKVCRQSIKAFETVPAGTEIDLYISTGEKAETDNQSDKDSPDKPSKPAKPKTVSLTLTSLPKDRTVTVKLVCDGVPIYESDVTTTTGTKTVSFQIEKTSSLLVYYDGVYIRQEVVTY